MQALNLRECHIFDVMPNERSLYPYLRVQSIVSQMALGVYERGESYD